MNFIEYLRLSKLFVVLTLACSTLIIKANNGRIDSLLYELENTQNSDKQIQFNLDLALEYYFTGSLVKAKEHAEAA